MYGNYKLMIYDQQFVLREELLFQNSLIEQQHNTVRVLNKRGKMIYSISTSCCTVVIVEVEQK